jgi:hypothetical protein
MPRDTVAIGGTDMILSVTVFDRRSQTPETIGAESLQEPGAPPSSSAHAVATRRNGLIGDNEKFKECSNGFNSGNGDYRGLE